MAATEYQKEWIKRKRKSDPVFAAAQAAAAREWQAANPIRYALSQYKQRARRRGMAWLLTDEAFGLLVTAPCHYCGSDGAPINGVDRVDSELGYAPDNVLTACAQCNYAKRHQTYDEFLTWVERITTFRRAD